MHLLACVTQTDCGTGGAEILHLLGFIGVPRQPAAGIALTSRITANLVDQYKMRAHAVNQAYNQVFKEKRIPLAPPGGIRAAFIEDLGWKGALLYAGVQFILAGEIVRLSEPWVRWFIRELATRQGLVPGPSQTRRPHVLMEVRPLHILCNITHKPVVDPVVAEDGYTYERSAIEAWLRSCNTSPVTGAELPSKKLIPNRTLRPAVEAHQDRSAISLQAGAS